MASGNNYSRLIEMFVNIICLFVRLDQHQANIAFLEYRLILRRRNNFISSYAGICWILSLKKLCGRFVMAGYGIAVDALGPFLMAGTWDLNNKGKLVGGFTQFIDSGSAGAQMEGKVNNDKLRVQVKSTEGPFRLKGDPAGDISDIGGGWNAKVRRKGKPFYYTFTSTLSTNVPAWFDITGSGANDDGAFTVTGAMLITPDNRVAAYTTYDYGTSTQTDAFVGKLRARGKRLVLEGRTDSHDNVSLKAERQQ